MKAPAKIAILNIITVVALSVMILVIVLLLAQNRSLTRDVKAQTDINQKYLRCILLIPQDQFDDTEQRVMAIDKCSLESRLPNGQPVGEAPTAQEREQQEDKQNVENTESGAIQPKPDISQAQQTANSERVETQDVQPAQPTVLDMTLTIVKDALPL